MKASSLILLVIGLFALNFFVVAHFLLVPLPPYQDPVEANAILQSVRRDWDSLPTHHPETDVPYAVLSLDGDLIFRTDGARSTSLAQAMSNGDPVTDVFVDDVLVGHLILRNFFRDTISERFRDAVLFFTCISALQCLILCLYFVHLHRTIIRPVQNAQDTAEQIACGNLDFPLPMNKHNPFGAFTESFDLMRSELQKSRLAEARAAEDKKTLISQLSHDLRTPVAAIQAAAELCHLRSTTPEEARVMEQIVDKCDQINMLLSNLLSASLEDHTELRVDVQTIPSSTLQELVVAADYSHRARVVAFPPCMVAADPLRMRQVFDNLFSNSYKYALNANIFVSARKEDAFLRIVFADDGPGVPEDEAPRLTRRLFRGSNAYGIDGAGLGLYICSQILKKTGGELFVENGPCGLQVTILIPVSGKS